MFEHSFAQLGNGTLSKIHTHLRTRNIGYKRDNIHNDKPHGNISNNRCSSHPGTIVPVLLKAYKRLLHKEVGYSGEQRITNNNYNNTNKHHGVKLKTHTCKTHHSAARYVATSALWSVLGCGGICAGVGVGGFRGFGLSGFRSSFVHIDVGVCALVCAQRCRFACTCMCLVYRMFHYASPPSSTRVCEQYVSL